MLLFVIKFRHASRHFVASSKASRGPLVVSMVYLTAIPFIGAFSVELLVRRQLVVSFKAAIGTLVGFAASALMRVVFILIMAGFFIASWF